MNRSDPKQSVRELLQEAHPALVGLSHWIHANPEVGFEEHHASDWVNEWLQTAGFEVERGVADMPTALIGRFGPGPLHVAICVEYDALPEVGHACGHNVIAAAGVGAGLALASVADELGLRVSVMGTPAEESGGGKLAFIEAGHFGDVHAAAMVHPWPSDVATPDIIAITQLDVTYRGHEAHAAGFPHRGRNAADAMVIAQTAIGLLRQQLLPTDRVHGIVTKGGDAPNIIPALTRALFMVRAADRERLEELTGLVRRCFEAGALATGTEVEVVEGTRYANMIHDADLAALYRHNAEQLGRVFDDTPGAPVSTDMGDVSHVVPTIHPMIGIETDGAVNHQREFAEACATPSADKAILDGALGLAWTVIDAAQNQVIRARLLGDAVIREAVVIIQEVEELDSRADLLEGLAGAVATSDPELAAEITAAADMLEERADDLAELADSRFEEAQGLTDDALLDEVAGELSSDLEDIIGGQGDGSTTVEGSEPAAVAGILIVDELLADADVTAGADSSEPGSFGRWEPAGVSPSTGEETGTDAMADIRGVGEPDAVTGPEAAGEPAGGQEALESAQEVLEGAQRPIGSSPDADAAGTDRAHAAWEREFLEVARHAAWEDEFAVALATTAARTTPDEEVSGGADSTWDTIVAEGPSDAGEPASEIEPGAFVAAGEPAIAGPEPEPLEAVAEPEPAVAEAVAEPEPAVAEAVAEPEPEVFVAEPEPFEAVAEPEPAVAEAVAEPEPFEAVADPEPEVFVAAASSPWEQPHASDEASETVDDIWYSGAPDAELPSAERVADEPVGAAAGQRAEGFVWIPADDDER